MPSFLNIKDDSLETLFSMGTCPTVNRMVGCGAGAEWQVSMLSGPIPNLGGRFFRHRKRFDWGNGVFGHNILFSRFAWGFFKALWPWDNGYNQMLLDYDQPTNTFTRRIHDVVRTTPNPDIMIGKFFWGKCFLGYFSLTRITK